jgi:glutamine amidotransferase
MIVVVDYRMGNLGSIANMLKKIGVPAVVSSAPDEILAADKLILPGVGAFDRGMASLEELGLVPALREKVLARGAPVLGICLGMQLMTRASEEGALPGLGWVDAVTVRFPPASPGLKVPHMGWNTLAPRRETPLFAGMPEPMRFYFVHSFHVVCAHEEDTLAVTAHGAEFTSVFQHGNVVGVQFHPEKSHAFGMRLLGNFATRFPC